MPEDPWRHLPELVPEVAVISSLSGPRGFGQIGACNDAYESTCLENRLGRWGSLTRLFVAVDEEGFGALLGEHGLDRLDPHLEFRGRFLLDAVLWLNGGVWRLFGADRVKKAFGSVMSSGERGICGTAFWRSLKLVELVPRILSLPTLHDVERLRLETKGGQVWLDFVILNGFYNSASRPREGDLLNCGQICSALRDSWSEDLHEHFRRLRAGCKSHVGFRCKLIGGRSVGTRFDNMILRGDGSCERTSEEQASDEGEKKA